MKSFAGLPNKSSAITENLHRNRTGHQTRASTMKTLLTTCLCSLAFALVSLAQAPPPAQAPPATGGTSPGAQAPTNPAAAAQQPGCAGTATTCDELAAGTATAAAARRTRGRRTTSRWTSSSSRPTWSARRSDQSGSSWRNKSCCSRCDESSSDYCTRSGKARWCFRQQLVDRPVSQRRSGDVADSGRLNRSAHRCARAMHLVEWPLVPAGSETDRESFHRD